MELQCWEGALIMIVEHVCLMCDEVFPSREERLVHAIECLKNEEVDERITDVYAYGD